MELRLSTTLKLNTALIVSWFGVFGSSSSSSPENPPPRYYSSSSSSSQKEETPPLYEEAISFSNVPRYENLPRGTSSSLSSISSVGLNTYEEATGLLNPMDRLDDSIKMIIYPHRVYFYWDKGEWGEAIKYCQKEREKANCTNEIFAFLLNHEAMINHRLYTDTGDISYAKQAIDILPIAINKLAALNTKDKNFFRVIEHELIYRWIHLGNLYNSTKNYTAADNAFEKAYQIAYSINTVRETTLLTWIIACLEQAPDHPKGPVHVYKKVIEKCEEGIKLTGTKEETLLSLLMYIIKSHMNIQPLLTTADKYKFHVEELFNKTRQLLDLKGIDGNHLLTGAYRSYYLGVMEKSKIVIEEFNPISFEQIKNLLKNFNNSKNNDKGDKVKTSTNPSQGNEQDQQLLSAGDEFFKNGDFSNAIKNLKKALKPNSDGSSKLSDLGKRRAQFLLGASYFGTHAPDEAIRCLGETIRIDSTLEPRLQWKNQDPNTEALTYQILGRAYDAKGKINAAIHNLYFASQVAGCPAETAGNSFYFLALTYKKIRQSKNKFGLNATDRDLAQQESVAYRRALKISTHHPYLSSILKNQEDLKKMGFN